MTILSELLDQTDRRPRGTLGTPLGTCEYIWNGHNAAYLCFSQGSPAIIRGIPYSISFHVKRPSAGALWERDSYHYPYLNRLDAWNKSPSQAAVKHAHDVLLSAWQAFAIANKETAREAERVSIESAIASHHTKIASLQSTIAEHEVEIERLRRKLDSV